MKCFTVKIGKLGLSAEPGIYCRHLYGFRGTWSRIAGTVFRITRVVNHPDNAHILPDQPGRTVIWQCSLDTEGQYQELARPDSTDRSALVLVCADNATTCDTEHNHVAKSTDLHRNPLTGSLETVRQCRERLIRLELGESVTIDVTSPAEYFFGLGISSGTRVTIGIDYDDNGVRLDVVRREKELFSFSRAALLRDLKPLGCFALCLALLLVGMTIFFPDGIRVTATTLTVFLGIVCLVVGVPRGLKHWLLQFYAYRLSSQ